MDPVWPATLPALTEVKNYSEQPPDTLLRSSTDTGPPKLRRRSTANIRPLSGVMLLTAAQTGILDTFFVDDLAGGALAFAGVHPRTGVAIRANLKRPGYRARPGGLLYDVNLEIEVLP